MIYRKQHVRGSFISVDKDYVNDPDLSLGAKGLMTYLLSKNENWDFYIPDIMKHSKNKQIDISKCIKELEDCGYLFKYQKRKDTGKGFKWIWIVYEDPSQNKREKPKNNIDEDKDDPF
jgi:DNA-binding MarR family transcriptional regulator